jgi:clan AA aspartic protease (TIGR02281 family)
MTGRRADDGAEDADEYLSTRQLAQWLGVDERTPEGWRARKTGPPFVRIEGCVRYSRRTVREWLKAKQVEPEKEPGLSLAKKNMRIVMIAGAIIMIAAAMCAGAVAETVLLQTHADVPRTEVILHEDLRVPAIVDTGSRSLGICTPMALALRLPLGAPVRMETANGITIGNETTLRSLRIGPIRLHDLRAVVHPPGASCREVLLGMSVLRRLRALILRRDTVRVVGDAPPSRRRAEHRRRAHRGTVTTKPSLAPRATRAGLRIRAGSR